jgi:single-stranded-DNA-specific exonuclease
MEWRERPTIITPEPLRARVGGHPLVAERLARLGLVDPDAAAAFLDPTLYQCASPFDLPDMDAAVARLQDALRTHEPILIWGDFDVDGQAATALLFEGLQRLGANVRYHIPLRNGEGHGVRLPKLRALLEHHYRLIISCDTGITAHEAIQFAQREGVDVIVTDHHSMPAQLPSAHAVLHPHRLPHGHKLRDLPGVGVAYELIRALNENAECTELLDLVALGIVADSAMLAGETRYLLQRGLAALRVSSRLGVQALCARAEANQLECDERDIAFSFVPRLNAPGRFADAADAVELLTTADAARAQDLSFQLEALNAQRKLLTRHVAASAHSLIERDPSLLEYAALVLVHPEWDNAVTGFVTQQLAEEYNRPTVLLCEKDDLAFGSARSVAGCNITDALQACATRLLKFGGHAMAAGVTLRRDEVYDFRRDLSATVREMLAAPVSEAVLWLDGFVALNELTPALYEDLQRLAPFGHGNAPLVLAARNVRVVRQKKLGREEQHLRLTLTDESGAQQPLFWWNVAADKVPAGRFDVAFRFVLNRHRQQTQLALEYVAVQAREHETSATQADAGYVIEDYRQDAEPHARLAQYGTGSVSDLGFHSGRDWQAQVAHAPRSVPARSVIWREDDSSINGQTRAELTPAETLIVWTVPPGAAEWQAALDTVEPRRLILFGHTPAPFTVTSWLQRLAGLAKFALKNKGGVSSLTALAAATAQREAAVRYGLLWLQQAGKLGVKFAKDGTIQLSESGNTTTGYELPALEKLIESTLAETLAYRKNWLCSERPDRTAM